MGRKIPGKKHKGVKDPEKQRRKRVNSLKGKVNVPPSNPDYQEVPHSVTKIAELKEQLKNRKFPPRNKPDHPPIRIQRKPKNKKNKEGAFQQFKGETDKHFLHRVHKACDAVIHEKAFEIKYGVDIKRNPTTGEVEKLVKRPKDEIELLMKEAQKNKKDPKNKKKKPTVTEPVLTKSQKRQNKLKERKAKKLGLQETSQNVDVIKFGEVAHEPPTLSAPRRVTKSDSAPRPGVRNLLLKSVMQNSKEVKKPNKIELNLKKTANKGIDKTGKRKNLPNALRRRLETQQAEIIDAYRTLKKQKNLSLNV